MAKLDGYDIVWAVRFGKNGRKYYWDNPSQELLDKLIAKYGVDSIDRDERHLYGVWLQW